MLLIYIALIIAAVAVLVPAFLENQYVKGIESLFGRRVGAYIALAFFSLVMPLFAGQLHFDIMFAALGAALAVMIADVTMAGLAFALFMNTVIFPISILYQMCVLGNLPDPLQQVFDKMEWTQLALPLVSGLIVAPVVRKLLKHWKWKMS